MQHLQKTGVPPSSQSLSPFAAPYLVTSLLPYFACPSWRADGGAGGEEGSGEAGEGGEFGANDAPLGANGGDDVAENFIDGVFVEDAQAAIGEEIHFQGFQLDAVLFRHVLDGDGAEIRKTGLGADGGVFGKTSGDDVAGKLIGPGLQRRQFCLDAGAGVFGSVVGHERSSRPLYRGSARVPKEGSLLSGVRRLLARDFQPCENHFLPERQRRYRLRVRT